MDLLIVCDESEAACDRLVAALRDVGHVLEVAADPDLALLARRHDAVVLCGGAHLSRLRQRHPEQKLLAWLPAASTERTADLLADGADEVVHGGMGTRELAARVVAVRRDAHPALVVELGGLRIDVGHGEATWRERPLPLTPREREVLRVLASEPGRPIRRESLYRQVWGYAMTRGDRTVDVNVKRLRDKLAAAGGGELTIATQPGVGYRLDVTQL